MNYIYLYILIIVLLIIIVYLLNTTEVNYNKSVKKLKIEKKEVITDKVQFLRKMIELMNYTTMNLMKEFPSVNKTLQIIQQKLVKASQIINNDPNNVLEAYKVIYSAVNDLQGVFLYIISLRNLKYEKKYICSFVNDLYNLILTVYFKDFEGQIQNAIFLLKEFVIYNFYFTKLRTPVKERDVRLFMQFINNLFLFYINKQPSEELKNMIMFEIDKTKNLMRQVEKINKRLNYVNNV